MTCSGCGPANPRGLRIKSYLGDGCIAATFMPWPEHDNGLGFLNVGIIATVLDCHTAAGVLNEASLRGWDAPPGALLPFVTAGIDVRYLRPSPLDGAVQPNRSAGYLPWTPDMSFSFELLSSRNLFR
jgi:hypothetical protein